MNYTLYGDSCMDVMQHMDPVELVLTDIPYDAVNRKSNGLRNLDKGDADIKTFDIDDFMVAVLKVCKGSLYIFCGFEQISPIVKAVKDAKMSVRVGVLEKTNPSPMNGQYLWLSGLETCVYGKRRGAAFNEHCKKPIWQYPCVRRKVHPTEKPLKLMERLITASSNPGDTVFDPCMGSGTTGAAAVALGRNFVGCEINPEYLSVAQERIKNSLTTPKSVS